MSTQKESPNTAGEGLPQAHAPLDELCAVSTLSPEINNSIEMVTPQIQSLSTTSDETSSLPLTNFERFPDLPAEIRLMIWKLLLPGKRVVEVLERRRFGGKKADLIYDSSLVNFTWTSRAPVLFHINQESRAEAEKIYELIPLYKLVGWQYESSSTNGRGIYFNYELDTLYFSAANLGSIPKFGRKNHEEYTNARVKHLAVDSFIVNPDSLSIKPYYQLLQLYPALETLTLVRDWTTWNHFRWKDWWPGKREHAHQLHESDLHEQVKAHHAQGLGPFYYRPIHGLSMNQRCLHEGFAMLCFQNAIRDGGRALHFPVTHHPKHLLKAYFGKGTFVEPYAARCLDEDEYGPREEAVLKGPEAEVLSDQTKKDLEELRLEEKGYADYFQYLNL